MRCFFNQKSNFNLIFTFNLRLWLSIDVTKDLKLRYKYDLNKQGGIFVVAKILDGKQISKDYRQGLQDQVEALKEKGYTPKLSVILVGNDGASQSYVNSKKKAAEKIGMISEIVHLDEDTSEEDVLKELDRLNNDDSVSGILVQVPLPKQVSEQKS